MERHLTIYYTSDIHGCFSPVQYATGKQAPSGLANCLSQFQKDGNTLIIDGGDTLQGSPLTYYLSHEVRDVTTLPAQLLNLGGYDFVTLGNHDFDYGKEVIERYLDSLHAVCLCANVEGIRGVQKTTVVTMENGLRVGLTGIITPFVTQFETPENMAGITVTDAFAAAWQALSELRRKQVDLTICIYHGGFEADVKTGKILSQTGENQGWRICRELGFDVLLAARVLVVRFIVCSPLQRGRLPVSSPPRQFAARRFYMLRIIHERRWNIYTFYGSAEIFQILFRLFIAAQQMTQSCQLALALCHHGCRQQCRCPAQILRPELCPVQLPHPAHAGCAACDLNVRAELSKLRHVQKAPLKNGLPKLAAACRLQNRCHQKRLCVGRKAGIRRGRNRKQRQKPSTASKHDTVRVCGNFAARLAKTLNHRQQQPCVAAQKLCLAAAACCHAEIRRRLNPVGKNRICRAVQTAYAANLKA